MKDNKSYLLVAIAIVVALVIGYVVGHAPKNDETDKASLYLPVYEFTATDGKQAYSNNIEVAHGVTVYTLSRTVPCENDFCKWVYKEGSSIYGSNWIMLDTNDSNSKERKGGYYFYDFEKDERVAGPFDTIEFEEYVKTATLTLDVTKVIVEKDDKSGFYDLELNDYLLAFGSNHISFEDRNKVLYEKDGKYYYYLYEGREKLTSGEYNSIEEYYTANGLEGDIE